MSDVKSLNSMTLDSTILATPDQVSAELAGEAVILDMKSGMYYGLNPVGVRIWELIGRPCRVSDVKAVLLDEYEVDPARCERDLFALLRELSANGLIEVKDQAHA